MTVKHVKTIKETVETAEYVKNVVYTERIRYTLYKPAPP